MNTAENLRHGNLQKIADSINTRDQAVRELELAGEALYGDFIQRKRSLRELIDVYQRLRTLMNEKLPLSQRIPEHLPFPVQRELDAIARETVQSINNGQISKSDAAEFQQNFLNLLGSDLGDQTPGALFQNNNDGITAAKVYKNSTLSENPATAKEPNKAAKPTAYPAKTSNPLEADLSNFISGLKQMNKEIQERSAAIKPQTGHPNEQTEKAAQQTAREPIKQIKPNPILDTESTPSPESRALYLTWSEPVDIKNSDPDPTPEFAMPLGPEPPQKAPRFSEAADRNKERLVKLMHPTWSYFKDLGGNLGRQMLEVMEAMPQLPLFLVDSTIDNYNRLLESIAYAQKRNPQDLSDIAKGGLAIAALAQTIGNTYIDIADGYAGDLAGLSVDPLAYVKEKPLNIILDALAIYGAAGKALGTTRATASRATVESQQMSKSNFNRAIQKAKKAESKSNRAPDGSKRHNKAMYEKNRFERLASKEKEKINDLDIRERKEIKFKNTLSAAMETIEGLFSFSNTESE